MQTQYQKIKIEEKKELKNREKNAKKLTCIKMIYVACGGGGRLLPLH
jgi:hypothetical protein